MPSIQEGEVGPLLEGINSARRALVILTVPWSVHALNARASFRTSVDQLVERSPELGVQFFILDEDSRLTQDWLGSLEVPQFDGTYSIGAGSIMWLENGSVVSFEIGGSSLLPGEIVGRTLSVWSNHRDDG